ncbi:hypothetical protein ACFL1R_05580 [Candidatus Latescibacterota bacterium]
MKKLGIICTVLFFGVHSAFGGQIVMTTSDYSSGNTATYDTETGILTNDILPHHQDAYAVTDGRYLYIIEGFGKNSIIKVDPEPISEANVVYNYSVSGDGSETNPHDMVFLDTKAYVLLNSSDKIWIVNPDASGEASFKTGEIDISGWADADGSPEAYMGFVYDGMVYVVCQMGDTTAWPVTYTSAVILKIDPVTDSIVDMDTETDDVQGIELILKNPQKASLVGSFLYLACSTYDHEKNPQGVMSVDLKDPLNTQLILIDEQSLGGTLRGIDVFTDNYGLVYTLNESYNAGIPRIFNPQNGALGDNLPVPDSGGGLVLVDAKIYVGVRDFTNPGLYIVDKSTNTLVAEPLATTLPPYTITYIESDISTEVSVKTKEPEAFVVEAAYPNPFNPYTTFSFHLARAANIRAEVFTAGGQKIDELVNSYMNAGSHAVVWNAAGRSSGVYHIRVTNGISSCSSKVTLIK